MKILLPFHLLIITTIIFCGCNSDGETTVKPNEEVIKDRNMFGIGMPRGIILNTKEAAPGYIMFCVYNSPYTYLINRAGKVVHQWKSNYGVQGSYIRDDGSLVVDAYDVDFPVFAGGGEAGRLQIINWDSKLLWDFEYADESSHHHHDFAILPNGNILAIAWEAKSVEEARTAGRKPEMIPKAGLWPDKIVELEPQGKRHAKIVWEWHIWDHMIQDFDPEKANFGRPGDHPELLDINVGRPLPPQITQDSMDILQKNGNQWRNQTAYNRGSDLYHINSINYNEALDQIVLSSPNLSEIFIIDHSTTSQEAASHTGGRWGKGGDFLYRWGNPQNYRRGDEKDQQLFHQHDARWIERHKPGAGNLTIFNNDIPGGPDSMNYSSVIEIKTPMDENRNYMFQENGTFGPDEPVWKYIAPDTSSFYASFISGSHRIENGNTFINEGPKARFFEVTVSGEIVWEYWVPYRGEIRKPNGDPIPPVPYTFLQFRSTFIPDDHPALVGKNLRPLDPQPIEFVLSESNNNLK